MNGFAPPNYTQVPNLFLDGMAAEMQEAELRVALVIMRETFGWHRESKQLSLSYLEKATGMSRQGVINGIKAGLERGVFSRKPVGFFDHTKTTNPNAWEYSLVVNEVDQGSQRSGLGVVNEVDTTKKEKEIPQKVLDFLRSYYKSQPIGSTRNSMESERRLDEHVDLVDEYGWEVYEKAALTAMQYKDIRYANNIEQQIVRDRAQARPEQLTLEPVEVEAAWMS